MGNLIQYPRCLSLQDYEEKLKTFAEGERQKGNKIILASGAFDILKPGHISYLRKIKEEYKKENGILFVNVENGARVKFRKGLSNLISKEYDRSFLISSIKGVDYVSVHPEEISNPTFRFASIIKPDYIIQAKTWTEELKKELSSFFEAGSLPKLVEFERISELDFSKISLGQFIQFEKYDGMSQYRKKLEEIIEEERKKGKKVVLTPGTFDVLNPGHVHYLNNLKKKYPKSILFVNIENDARVRIRKGKDRPINSSYNRAFVISNLEAVDYTTVHPEETSNPIFQVTGIIRPNYLIMPISTNKKAKKELKEILGKDYYKTRQIRFSREYSGSHTTDFIKRVIKFHIKGEDRDPNEFALMHLSELSKKLKESDNLNDFYKKNPETFSVIQALKKLTKKSEKYPEIRYSIISNVLKLKKAWDLSSYDELNEFLSKLAEFNIPGYSLDEK